ncbi:MAG: 6-bladed beta-propeller [Flavobacteriales bacterium]|nr:6-bladed beta-propeller [Flavobacteriales bacterium]
MKKTPFILIVLSILIGCGNIDKKAHYEVPHIHIDVNTAEKHMDMSEYLDTSFFKAIPLETTAECLVGKDIMNVWYRNGRIYVWEEQTESVFMFDENGKFIDKIADKGEGPNEYTSICNVSITDSLICIFDHFCYKLLYYDLDCNFIKRVSTKHVYQNVTCAAYSFMIKDRVFFGIHFREDFRTDMYGAPHKWVSMDLDLNKESVKRFLPYDYDCPTESESHFSLPSGYPYTAINDKVRFMISNLDTIFVATQDTIVPEYVLDFGVQSVPVRLYKTTYHEAKYNDEFDNYVTGIQHMLDTEDYIILQFRYGDYSMKEILASIPDEIRNDYKKKADWLNRNRPTTQYYLFINKKTGETRLTNGLFFETLNRPFSIKIADGKYLIEPRNNHPYSFNEDGTHGGYSMPHNPRVEKILNEAYSTVKLDDNPVLFIYKFKDVE